jgi:hypothetical protein
MRSCFVRARRAHSFRVRFACARNHPAISACETGGVARGLFQVSPIHGQGSFAQVAFQADQLEASSESTDGCVFAGLGGAIEMNTRGAACGLTWTGAGVGVGAGADAGAGAGAGAGAAVAGCPTEIALSRVPPCHEFVSTKSCSTLTLPIVTFVVWNTLSFRLATMRY